MSCGAKNFLASATPCGRPLSNSWVSLSNLFLSVVRLTILIYQSIFSIHLSCQSVCLVFRYAAYLWVTLSLTYSLTYSFTHSLNLPSRYQVTICYASVGLSAGPRSTCSLLQAVIQAINPNIYFPFVSISYERRFYVHLNHFEGDWSLKSHFLNFSTSFLLLIPYW